jgi:alpha-L-rhamnosidase
MLGIRNVGTLSLLFIAAALSANAQVPRQPVQLDPTANISSPQLEANMHKPLPEQFIWMPIIDGRNPGDSGYFRSQFKISARPATATLYVVGPEQMRVYVNGMLIANAERDIKTGIHPMVIALDVSRNLRAGINTVAIAAVRGNRLAVKIIPRGAGVMSPAILMSGPGWKSSIRQEQGWEKPDFTDAKWPPALALGGVESSLGNLRWNNDAGMYRWPGYDGISPYLAHLSVPAEEVAFAFEGMGKFTLVNSLAPNYSVQPHGGVRPPTAPAASGAPAEFSVTLPPGKLAKEDCPYVTLDFGREITGRLEIVSDSTAPVKLEIQYGESMGEVMGGPYLGGDELTVLPHVKTYGPKSAFRYALIRFLEGPSPMKFTSIQMDDIYYPVTYKGSFESSDPVLNRIWQTGAYTSHLCMEDDIWDAPKRDRAPWMGDLDVSGLVIDTVFADQFLMRETMDALMEGAGDVLTRDVNGIPGYSAFWVMGQADYYRHIGDVDYLHKIHDPLVHLLDFMASELDSNDLFANTRKAWPFIDWSPDMNGDTAEARRATEFEFYKAFMDGAWLLTQAGDAASANKFEARAQAMRLASQKNLLDSQTNTFGPRWQSNAMAIYSGVADPAQTSAIYDRVLSKPSGFVITPYYNFYVISAMAEAGHRTEALDWIRKYWGGMIDEGATSFWEAYDLSWPKNNFHRSLQADNGQGYYVSLSHGWSSGPTAWLSEEVLGIRPTAAGFKNATIRPDLAGLAWARGAVPTPNGLIKVEYKGGDTLHATVDLPAGVAAEVSMPVCGGANSAQPVMMNGAAATGMPSENGTRLLIPVTSAGHYEFVTACSVQHGM